jgi:hypothetical protein
MATAVIGRRTFSDGNKGPSSSRIFARGHRPEICFTGAGYKLQADRGNIIIRIQNLSIPFHAMDFEYQGKQLYVFFCLAEDGLKPSERSKVQVAFGLIYETRICALRKA